MRFSVIVPIYNVEKYLRKCFDSILGQTYSDFEIIAVNDGSPDNSQKIIDEYVARNPEKMKGFMKENGGLSDARNYGIERASGDYLVFVDSDDCIASDMLETLDKEIEKNDSDVIGINLVRVNEKGEQYDTMSKPVFSALSGEMAIKELVLYKQCFDPACGFVYKTEYWNKNGFSFTKGIYHEDYALVPLVVLFANKVSCIDYAPYFYLCNQNSITQNVSPEKKRKMAYDLLIGYDGMLKAFNASQRKDGYCSKLFLHYIASPLIFRLGSLQDSGLKAEFRKELKKRKVIDNIMNDTMKRKIRKTLIKLKNRL